MSFPFRQAYTKDVSGGFVADADPRVTPPAADRIFQLLPMRMNSIVMHLDFLDAGGVPIITGVYTYELWMKDETTGNWVGPLVTQTNVAEQMTAGAAPFITGGAVPQGADLFVRVTAATIGAAVQLVGYYLPFQT